MASQYAKLGLIYRTRGELDRAEEILREALTIYEELGAREGIAIQYANLGGLLVEQEKHAEARGLWTKSRDLYTEIGMPHMVEQLQGWLDDLPNDDTAKEA